MLKEEKEKRWEIAIGILSSLCGKGVSLYRIAIDLGWEWNTLDYWQKRKHFPTAKRLKFLQKYYLKVVNEKSKKTVQKTGRIKRNAARADR